MGIMRKALWVSTGGLSGVAVKANSKKERAAKAAEKQLRLAQAEARTAVRPVSVVPPAPASGPGVADELGKLAALRDQGALTEEEFTAAKGRLLNP